MYDLQKANVWKRISAFLFDLIMLVIAIVASALFLSAMLGYDGLSKKLESSYNEYEELYGVDFEISAEDYEKLDDVARDNYDAAKKAVSEDKDIMRLYELMINYTLIIITFSVLIAHLLLEFLVPIVLKNGQTLGKKIFGVGVMREDGVKISNPALFVRAILGKYTIETMIPVMTVALMISGVMGIFGVVVLGILLVTEIAVCSVDQNRPMVHDKMARTVCVDLASQMIFESESEMLEYKKRLQKEKAEKQTY